jgi:hypothetical protein
MYRPSKASMLGLYGSAWLTYDLRYLAYLLLTPTTLWPEEEPSILHTSGGLEKGGGAAFLQVDETGKANAVFVNVESGRGISQLDGDGDGDGCGEPAKAESPS